MSVTEHKGWQIESRSYEADGNRWYPRALIGVFEGGRLYTHDVVALLNLTFDTALDADDYAIKMAKAWIEDRAYASVLPRHHCHSMTRFCPST